jgi:hypothetical protein
MNAKRIQYEPGLTQGADDPAHGQRRELDENWSHEDSIGQRTFGLPEHIHDFDFVTSGQVRLAYRIEIGHCLGGVGCVACDIQPEFESRSPAHIEVILAE